MSTVPPPPTPNSRVELYTQEPMVNWLGPLQLLRTGLRAAVATTLGAFADPREVQAALNPRSANLPIPVPGDAGGDVWIDYLADTGDGWNSTYTMALCLSRDLDLAGGLHLPRGKVLLLGGDQVYPTPARGGYRTRFLDPFRAAFPAPVPEVRPMDPEEPVPQPGAPWMVATPGNHDWYDGLRGFAQLFCNRKPVGGWDTRQCTSYYVLELPNGWWIWGLDLQLESMIDRPQKQYFEEMRKALQPGDRVVLCAPEPSWVDEAERVAREAKSTLASIETQTPRFRSLREVEQLLGDHLALVLAGDSHHYAHYAPLAGSTAPHRITCGGGGAFLHGTHALPDEPHPIMVGGARQNFRLAGVYPDKETSRHLRNQAWRLPTRNVAFCATLASLYLLFVWMVQSASKVPEVVRGGRTLMEVLADLELSSASALEACRQLFWAMAHSPSAVVFALAIIAGCGAWTWAGVRRAPRLAFIGGTVHGVLHLGLAVALLWLMGRVNIHWLGLNVDSMRQVLLFLAETLMLGGSLGGLLFGAWMVVTNALWGLHAEEVFSSQRIADYKCFLRMRFRRDGLTVHPIKVDTVGRRWKVASGVTQEARSRRTSKIRAFFGSQGPRFVHRGATSKPSLIEPPIEIRKGAAP